MKKYLKLILIAVACFILIRACFSCGEDKQGSVQEETIPVIDNGKKECSALSIACCNCGADKKETVPAVEEDIIPVIDNGKTNVLLYHSPDVFTAEIMLEGSGWKRWGDTFIKDNWIATIADEPEWVKIETVLMADNVTGKAIANEMRDYYSKIYFNFSIVQDGTLWGVYDGKIYNGRKKEQTDQYILMEYICDDVRYCRVTYATKKKNNN